MNKVVDYLKHKQKGQGIVEYALLLAFVVGIAMTLNGANLGGAVKDTFDKVAAVLGGEKTYAQRYSEWKNSKNDAIRNAADNNERIKVDQEGLYELVKDLIGKTPEEVNTLLKTMNPTSSVNYVGPQGTTNESSKIQPIEYFDNYEDNDLVMLQYKQSGAAIEQMSGQSVDVVANNNAYQTTTTNRFFYSDDMLAEAGDNYNDTKRTVKTVLTYKDGVVESAHVWAETYKGNDRRTAEGLNLTVTSSGYTTTDYRDTSHGQPHL